MLTKYSQKTHTLSTKSCNIQWIKFQTRWAIKCQESVKVICLQQYEYRGSLLFFSQSFFFQYLRVCLWCVRLIMLLTVIIIVWFPMQSKSIKKSHNFYCENFFRRICKKGKRKSNRNKNMRNDIFFVVLVKNIIFCHFVHCLFMNYDLDSET